MADEVTNDDILTLRFVGQDGDGVALHELRASHVGMATFPR
jgi:hypothetical protein